MKVEIGRTPPAVAALALHRACEAAMVADPESPRLTAKQRKLVNPRFHALVTATAKLSPSIVAAIGKMRAAFLERAKLREAMGDEHGGSEYDEAIDAMTPEALEAALTGAFDEMSEQGMRDVRAEIGIDFDAEPERAIAALRAYAAEFAADVTDDEKTALKALIEEALREGSDTQELARLIAIHFADGVHRIDDEGHERTMDLDSWAQTVARTETARAYNEGAASGYAAAGIEYVVWVTADDERVCPLCRPADRQVVALGEVFPFVDVQNGPAHPNCRCITVGLSSATKSMVPEENIPEGWEP